MEALIHHLQAAVFSEEVSRLAAAPSRTSTNRMYRASLTDLAKLNPKCHMNYSQLFVTETNFLSYTAQNQASITILKHFVCRRQMNITAEF